MCTRIIAVFVIAALPWRSSAADAPSVSNLIAPYLDEQTMAVVHLDVTAIDVDGPVERVAKATGFNVQLIAGPQRAVREALAAFRKAGAKDVYAVVSAEDLPMPGPFVLIPRAGTNDADLKSALAVLGSETVEPLDGMMFAGGKRSRDRFRG